MLASRRRRSIDPSQFNVVLTESEHDNRHMERSNGNWSTAADWSGGVPAAGDSVVINTTQLDTITYDSASPSVSVASLTVGDDNL